MESANQSGALMPAGSDVFRARRERVLKQLGDAAALILTAAPELVVGRDVELRYVVDSELFYLTGYREPEAVAVFMPAHKDAPFTLFVRPRDPARELWTGFRGGVEAATETFGANAAFPIAQLNEQLAARLLAVDRVYARLDNGRPEVDELIKRTLTAGRRARARTGRGPMELADPGVLLDNARLIKDEHELNTIRRAAQITVEAFTEAAARIRPNAGEWEVEAALESGFRRREAVGFAFPTIVAGGTNATVLHYVTNDRPLRDGDLVLLDAGARYHQYCADISRTYPVNGRFSAEQKVLYDCVLAANVAAIEAVGPDASADDVHNAAVQALTTGLRSIGLIAAEADASAQETALKKYFPHKTSHWLGLDVHDVGAYATRDGPITLVPGMVLTIEPGLYIPADETAAPEAFRGIGIRIEDDVLVTADGHEVLTAGLPKGADEVVAWLQRLANRP